MTTTTETPLERIIRRLQAGVMGISVLFLSAMAVIVMLNVASRYVLHVSLTWSAELARYCLVWSAMLAAAVLVGRDEHLSVDVLERRLPERLRDPLTVATNGLSLTFFAALFVSGIMLVRETTDQVASSMDWLPMSVVYAVVPASALLMFLGAANVLWRTLTCRGRAG